MVTLANLTEVNLTPEEAIHIWRGRNAAGVRTVVAVDEGKVIGTASLILEHKFLHRGGTIGHIEDVAVHPSAQGKGVGTAVVQSLVTAGGRILTMKKVEPTLEDVFIELVGHGLAEEEAPQSA